MNLDGGDPRMGSSAGIGFGDNVEITRSAVQKLHDPNVSFEEYMHYAAITRADDRVLEAPTDGALKVSGLKGFGLFKGTKASVAAPTTTELTEKEVGASPDRGQPLVISDTEYVQASRAVRTATWGAVFYLITTDILGPYSTA